MSETTETISQTTSWEEWKVALLTEAARFGASDINPDEYRDYYEDGHSPAETWMEDRVHAS